MRVLLNEKTELNHILNVQPNRFHTPFFFNNLLKCLHSHHLCVVMTSSNKIHSSFFKRVSM